MTTCEEVFDLIGPYVDDDLPDATRRRLQRHLLACAACAHEAETLRIVRERLRDGAGEVVASDAFRARTLARLAADNGHLAPDPAGSTEPAQQYQLPIRI